MSYKIVADSCCEFPKEYEGNTRYERIPLGLEVADELIMDDENFDQAYFLSRVAASPKCPKSFCPSPEKFRDSYCTEAENVFVFTLSSKLSGSYNSAEVGKKLYHEKYGDKNIFVCDSESASCGETQLAFKAAQWSEAGLPFAEICQKLTDYRDRMNTYFVLDNLETLRKNGRLSRVKALVASTLSIKPVMGATKGEIIQLGQAIGIKKALAKMANIVASEAASPEEKTLMITHCNCPGRAESVKEMILSQIKVKDVLIMDTKGVSSMYANDGGVIVTL
ncbi:DegV family protein [Parablautia muri]|uniref:DegV family protein n=1 Tax=Parablautia muri TaxID=2320879 RepID=A0A9X5BGW8_9FIRM|nr:DegV family protein [Parablautia muri]NBJ92692.1 DegV family protein [Parablautia muri]